MILSVRVTWPEGELQWAGASGAIETLCLPASDIYLSGLWRVRWVVDMMTMLLIVCLSRLMII